MDEGKSKFPKRERRIKNMWEVNGRCITGLTHREKGMECQDLWGYKYEGERQAVVLIDGASKKNESIEVYKAVVDGLAEYIVKNMDMLMKNGKEEIKLKIMNEVLGITEKYMKKLNIEMEEQGLEKKLTLQDCACTLMAVGIDNNNEKHCVFHLGDGIIMQKNTVDEWEISSYPHNFFYGNLTWHTVTKNAVCGLKFYRAENKFIKSFRLMTDGAYQYPAREDLIRKMYTKYESNKWDLEEWLKSILREDDIGFIEIKRRKNIC